MNTLSYKTVSANAATVDKNWVVVDAEGQTLGRLASKVALLLRGKRKPNYTPHVDCGDNVIILNADKGADPKVQGLLYAGTETGFYISFNDGNYWEAFQSNLPVVPINDLFIQDNDLIAATAGRSFWILDDLSPLQQHQKTEQIHLVAPKTSYRISSVNTPKSSASACIW